MTGDRGAGDLISSLGALSAYQIEVAPRLEEDAASQARTINPISAALSAANGALNGVDGSLLASLWIREPGEAAIRFIVGGHPFLPGARPSVAAESYALPYPPGSLGRVLEDKDPSRALGGFGSWLGCRGEPDVLWRGETTSTESHELFCNYVMHLGAPFAWLVVASPVGNEEISRQLAMVDAKLAGLRQKTSLESDRADMARLESRYEEISRGRVLGLWDVRVLIGGEDAAAAHSAARLLCSSISMVGLPYVLVPSREVASFEEQLESGDAAPFLASTEYLSALVGPPSVELPGIRLHETNPFDVTPDPARAGSIHLGSTLDRAGELAEPVGVSRSTLNRHTFVTGSTGSGKSQTTRWLLEQLARDPMPVPWLVLEPAKAEYVRMAGRLDGVSSVLRIRPGAPDVAPACLNPLEPSPGYPLQSHVDLVRALFIAAFDAVEPFPQVLSQALSRCYSEAGWDLVTGEARPKSKPRFLSTDQVEPASPRYPGLSDLQRTARAVVEAIGYGPEITANVRGFVDVRMGSLCSGTPGRFFQGGHPLDVARLLEQNTVIELEGITDDQDKAFLIGAFIIRVVEHLRVLYGDTGCDDLKHVLVVEEAHRLLKNVEDGPAAAAVDLFASMLAEIRAYGEGIMIVEQIPSKVSVDVIKNTALKVVHRLPALDDRDAVGGTINLTEEQSRFVVSMPPGIAAVAADGMDRPVLTRISPGTSRETPSGAGDDVPLTGLRSPLCHFECQSSPCTLRAINEATHTARDPWVTLWVEGLVIGLLCGLNPPKIARLHGETLRSMAERERSCALAHAVERAVDARAAFIRKDMDPSALKAEVVAQALHQLEHCDLRQVSNFPKWQTGPHRYRDALTTIANRQSQNRDLEPQLRKHYIARGLNFGESTTLDQMADQVRAYHQSQDRRAIIGDTGMSGLVDAVVVVGGAQTREAVRRAFDASCEGPATGSIATEVCLGLGLEREEAGAR